ncbi:uncharacterized protein N7483_002975 [Penicillium malachiteum]|uniref:uncharacterized protein n=1 Tax=Penicillium malachiteum TaxID=1324776 RepID=UPI002548EDEF|nr:uncharacterized protein N7483_002975 [Penicillium malachiteum]KAJ5737850.1 hypothetical protein N7483_002975 [Penicillium malachiteum]
MAVEWEWEEGMDVVVDGVDRRVEDTDGAPDMEVIEVDLVEEEEVEGVDAGERMTVHPELKVIPS